MIETPERRIEHVADLELDVPVTESFGSRSRASPTSVGDRSIATTCAPRRAASTDSAPVPQPGIQDAASAQVVGQPAQQGGAHVVAPGAHRRPDTVHRRVGGQPLPGIHRGAVEIRSSSPRRAA